MADTVPMVFTSKCHKGRSDARTKPVTAVSSTSNRSDRPATTRIFAWNHDVGRRSRRSQTSRSVNCAVCTCIMLRGFARLRCENCVKSARREVVPITRTSFKVAKQCVRFSFRKCTDTPEMIQRWLHKPCVKRVKIQRDLNLRADDNVIEPEIAKAAWKFPHDKRISQFLTGEVAESAP